MHDRVFGHQAPKRREIRVVFFEGSEQASEAFAKQVVAEIAEAGLFRGLFEKVRLLNARKLEANGVQSGAGPIERSNSEG